MKTWIKYFLSIVVLVIVINFWLSYQDFPHRVFWTVLVIVPALISAFFVYRLLKLQPKALRAVLSILVATTVTVVSINYREIIFDGINYITTDNETGLFIFYIVYFLQVLLLTWVIKFIDIEELKRKIKKPAQTNKQ